MAMLVALAVPVAILAFLTPLNDDAVVAVGDGNAFTTSTTIICDAVKAEYTKQRVIIRIIVVVIVAI